MRRHKVERPPQPDEADPMPRRPSASIARKARAKAEADFATWLMMAKLGSFEDLPADAQGWLMGYRTRLDRMSEADATEAAIEEIYVAYYAGMGGAGEAPDLARSASHIENNVVELKDVRLAKASHVAASPPTAPPRRALRPFLIFAGMVAALAAFKFAFGF